MIFVAVVVAEVGITDPVAARKLTDIQFFDYEGPARRDVQGLSHKTSVATRVTTHDDLQTLF